MANKVIELQEALEKFEAHGYNYQTPTRDRTYFFSKQLTKGHRHIWLELTNSKAIITCKLNNKVTKLTKAEDKLILNLLSVLGYTEYTTEE